MNLESNLKVLGLPVALTVVLSGLALLFGIDLAVVGTIAGTLLGMAALIALVINVLKWAGVINDGVAGKISAAGNLLVLLAVAVLTKWYPQIDIHAVDMQVLEFVKVASLVFVYVTQMVTSKRVHEFMVNGLGLTVFSMSRQRAERLAVSPSAPVTGVYKSSKRA